MAAIEWGDFQMVKFQFRVAVALILGLALAVSACGGDDKTAPQAGERKPAAAPIKPEPPLNAEAGSEGEIRYSGETESGDAFKAQIGGDVSVPSDFGSDLPAYPGAVAQSAIETTGGTAIAAFESAASADDIIEFYRDRLTAEGWSVEGVNDLGRGKLLTATKDGRRAMVNTERMDQGTRFMLSLGSGPAS